MSHLQRGQGRSFGPSAASSVDSSQCLFVSRRSSEVAAFRLVNLEFKAGQRLWQGCPNSNRRCFAQSEDNDDLPFGIEESNSAATILRCRLGCFKTVTLWLLQIHGFPRNQAVEYNLGGLIND